MTRQDLTARHETTNTQPRGVALLGSVTLAALAGVAALAVMDYDRVLLTMAALLVATGFAIALACLVSRSHRSDKDVTAWDWAGALVLLGFSSALLSS